MNYNELTEEQQIIRDLHNLINGYEKCRELGIHLDGAKVMKTIATILSKDRTLG